MECGLRIGLGDASPFDGFEHVLICHVDACCGCMFRVGLGSSRNGSGIEGKGSSASSTTNHNYQIRVRSVLIRHESLIAASILMPISTLNVRFVC